MENEDYYIVQPGDTLESIAERFFGGAEMAPLLKQINDIPTGGIREGLVLLLHPPGLDKEK